MNTSRMVILIAATGASLCAGQNATAQKATVTVCMESDPRVLMGVRPLASGMFAGIGVRIDWREPDACPAGVGAIRVRLSHDSRNVHDSSATALAYAQPFAGTIVVFLDRIQELSRNAGPSLTAHVLVHEITHLLEGIDRHSDTGIMKARWNDCDYSEMRRKPLPFASEDVDLIYNGLKVPRVAAGAVSGAAVAGQ